MLRFSGRTLRVDTEHFGDRTSEEIRVTDLVEELPWSGEQSLPRIRDEGDYRCSLVSADGELLYQVGFGSFFGEWASTAEGRQTQRGFSESVRIPQPASSAEIVFERRMPNGEFSRVGGQPYEPGSAQPAGTARSASAEVFDLTETKAPERAVNLLFVSEGYTIDEKPRFVDACEALSDLLFRTDPYQHNRSRLNVRGLFAASRDSGISDPSRGVARDTLLSAAFGAFGINRYVLTFENIRLRDLCAGTPYDALVILCNSAEYGGGGVFNQYACLSAHHPERHYLFVHEFGHSFGGLADEYYGRHVTYEVDDSAEPWNPNVTTRVAGAQLKWAELIGKSQPIPIPSPWNKRAYDELMTEGSGNGSGRSEKQLRERSERARKLLESERYAGQVGAFEGACYRSRGMYRPQTDCLMFSKTAAGFCRVCAHALEARIRELSSPEEES